MFLYICKYAEECFLSLCKQQKAKIKAINENVSCQRFLKGSEESEKGLFNFLEITVKTNVFWVFYEIKI